MNTQVKREKHPFREAMLEVLPRLRRFARGLTGSAHDADDLLQSTVERMLERGAPDGVDVTKWMFRVCRNLWVDELRARDVRRRAAQRLDLEAEPAASHEAALEDVAAHEVDRALRTLPEEQRAVLALVGVEGYSYREAAELLEIPIGTVMSRLARARAAMAAQLHAAGDLREAGNE